MYRRTIFAYGLLCYAIFLATFCYTIGFLGNFGTPTSVDGAAQGPLGMAIVINLVIAAVTGTMLPVLLDKAGIDPALAGSVLLTTVTDIVGFFAFLGLATVFLF